MLSVLAAIAVVGSALGVRSLTAAATMSEPAIATATGTAGATSTERSAAEAVTAPEHADPVGRDLPAAIGRTAALVVLLGAVLLARRQPAVASSVSHRAGPPRSGPTARSVLPGVTPGLLRV